MKKTNYTQIFEEMKTSQKDLLPLILVMNNFINISKRSLQLAQNRVYDSEIGCRYVLRKRANKLLF
ncbi:hypothetical protein L21SP5_03189 [Salinivirga cyanobacteriivorans]|uniref:Transposase n=1 Tax=Salinivirga cyanobacteriivorans TaxID=1307839 RepID=A0A0S2I3H6_9BACT|nr:hypothetical protein L21SP5_03189 [Salinivirga cyanobacteriivorans]